MDNSTSVSKPGARPPEEIVCKEEVQSSQETDASRGTELMDTAETDESQQPSLMHAMTPDGTTVPITFNPDTGQYMTATGEPVVIQVAGEEQQDVGDDEPSSIAKEKDENALVSTETADSGQYEGTEVPVPMTGVKLVQPDGSLTSVALPLSSIITKEQQPHIQVVQGSDEQQQNRQQIQIVNADGSVGIPQQQIRIVKMEGGTGASQIRVLGQDDVLSNLRGNIRLVQSPQIVTSDPTKDPIRVSHSSASIVSIGSPTKNLSLSQAQSMGVLSSPSKIQNIKIAASPVKREGNSVQKIFVRGGNEMKSQQPQVIRIPASNLQAGGLQPMQIGNKVQYVRVVGTKSQNSSQMTSLKSGTSMLPTGLKIASVPSTSGISGQGIPVSSLQGLKIALPPKQKSLSQSVVLAPSGGDSQVQPILAQNDNGVNDSSENVTVVAAEPPRMEIPEVNTNIEGSGQPEVLSFETSGVRPRKPCNCTKSQCLKLYCECFANGEFCNNCNCNNCFNNLTHEDQRQRAIKQCLERNPNAFKPKIGRISGDGERRHNKGCNCKRSGCLKNYCECYEAKIPCTDACKCLGCKNVEDETGRKRDTGFYRNVINNNECPAELIKPSFKTRLGSVKSLQAANRESIANLSGAKQPFSFITPEVVEATCQCLLAQAEESERNQLNEAEIEGLVIEEFGRCLSQIIDIASKAKTQTNFA